MNKKIKALCTKSVIMRDTEFKAFTEDLMYIGEQISKTEHYHLRNNSGMVHRLSKVFFDKHFILVDETHPINLKCVNSIKSNGIEIFIKGRTYGVKMSEDGISCISSERELPLAFINKHFEPIRGRNE
jgi:hypothetical protein